jgi:hypothetical protein
MKALIVGQSVRHGNTAQVARAMARVWAANRLRHHDLIPPDRGNNWVAYARVGRTGVTGSMPAGSPKDVPNG